MKRLGVSYLVFISLISIVACSEKNNIEQSKKLSENSTSTQNNQSIAINDSCIYYQKSARKMDSVLLNATKFEESTAIRANNLFVKCALMCNNDSISPLYLMKAAQLSQSLNKINLSEKYLKKIIEEYPKSKMIPATKFLLAQYYADVNLLNQPDKAKDLFNEIIKDYPNTIWSENAAAAMKWVGKSDEEILKELKKKK